MALAYLRLEEPDSQHVRFRMDIGAQPFFQYEIGTGAATHQGFPRLSGSTFNSGLLQRQSRGFFARESSLDIPQEHFDDDRRYVQITSFRDAQRNGPAWSEVVEARRRVPLVDPRERWRTTMSNSSATATVAAASAPRAPRLNCRRVAHDLSEPPLSAALFWDELLAVARHLVPAGSELVAGQVSEVAPGAVNPETVGTILNALLDAVGQASGDGARPNSAVATPAAPNPAVATPAAASPAVANPAAPAPAVAAPPRPGNTAAQPAGPAQRPASQVAVPAAASMGRINRFRAPIAPRSADWRSSLSIARLAKAQDGGVLSGPALAGLVTTLAPAVLNALGPLIRQAPQVLQALQNAPVELLNAIYEADRRDQALLNEMAQNQLQQGNQALLYHFLLNRAGAPSSVPGIPALAAPQTAGTPAPTALSVRAPSVASGPAVEHKIAQRLISPAGMEIAGSPRVLYARSHAITLQLALEAAPQPTAPVGVVPRIPRAIAEVCVKLPGDGSCLGRHSFQLTNIGLGEPVDLQLPENLVSKLPMHVDLLVSVDTRWPTRSGGVETPPDRAVQTLRLVEEEYLVGIDAREGEPWVMDDPIEHRNFWHRIWQGGATSGADIKRWQLEATVRYYFRLNTQVDSNGRIDPRFLLDEARSKRSDHKIQWAGKLKSGMELSLVELNQELARSGAEAWADSDLQLLDCEVFRTRVSQQSTANLKLRGRDNEQGSIWVFPALQRVGVRVASVVDVGELGEVRGSVVEHREFVVPVSSVFVGMLTD